MKISVLIAAAVLSASASTVCVAQVPDKGKPAAAAEAALQKRILEVLALAGVHKALEESAAAYERQLKKGLSEEKLKDGAEALNKAVRESLAPNRLLYFITREVAGTVNAQELETLSKWFSSPTGRKVVDAQVRGLPLMRDEAQLMRSGKEEESKQTMNRANLVADLVRASREGAVMANMAIRVGTSSLQKMNDGTAPPEMLAFFIKSIEDQRAAMTARFEGVAKARIAVTMKSLSDDEMRDLIKFESTPEERKLVAAVAKGTEVGVLDALDKLVEASKRVEEKKMQKKA